MSYTRVVHCIVKKLLGSVIGWMEHEHQQTSPFSKGGKRSNQRTVSGNGVEIIVSAGRTCVMPKGQVGHWDSGNCGARAETGVVYAVGGVCVCLHVKAH